MNHCHEPQERIWSTRHHLFERNSMKDTSWVSVSHRVTPMRLRCKAGFWMAIIHDTERGKKKWGKNNRTGGKLSIFIRVAYDLCF